jgi:hypothetical protein
VLTLGLKRRVTKEKKMAKASRIPNYSPVHIEAATSRLEREKTRLLVLTKETPSRHSAEAVLNDFASAMDNCEIELDFMLQEKAANDASTPAILDIKRKIAAAKLRVDGMR